MALVIMGFLVIAAGLSIRLLWLQVIYPDHWVTIARRQHLKVLELPPTRGTILDRNGKPLATSIRLTSVFADPRHVKNPHGVARKLAPVLDRPESELLAKLSRKDRGFVWLARRIPNQAAAQVRQMRIPAVDSMMEIQRVYPQGFLASHLIGFAGIDSEGLEGLEMAYNAALRGEPGWRWLSRDARQRAVGTWEAPMTAPRDGFDLVLTIDTTIQYFAERELDRAYKQNRAAAASIVVMEPVTGEILALANRPTFDPNRFKMSDADSRRNRSVTDIFEPGSVFKVVTAAVALGTGAVKPTDTFFCENGSYPVAGRVLHDHHPHGTLTFREVIGQSSNIGTVKAAMKIGADPLYKGLRAFGFGVPTGIGLPGEQGGMAPHPKVWSRSSITTIPMGQGVAVTAVQLAQAFSVVANGGLLVRPWVLKEVCQPSGELVKRFEPQVVRRVLRRDTAELLKEILVAAVEEGTGKLAQVPGFRAGGKTGTAQKIEPNGQYSHSRYIASFIGFVPAENPRLVIAVVVDEPRGTYFGGTVSAPVFSRVAADTLAYLRQGNLQTVQSPGRSGRQVASND